MIRLFLPNRRVCQHSTDSLRGRLLPLVGKGIKEPWELRTVEVLERHLDRRWPQPASGTGFVMHVIRSPSDPWLRRSLPSHRWTRAESNMSRGDVAYLAVHDQEVAARVWVTSSSHRDIRTGLRIRLGEGEAYSYDVQAAPAYRALGAGAFVMAGLFQDLKEKGGVKRVYGVVDERNRASQMLLRMVFGFTFVQKVTYCRLFAWGLQLPLTARPRLGPCSNDGHNSRSSSY